MTADRDAPVPYWPPMSTPETPAAMYAVPCHYALTPAAEAALEELEAN
jgi:hypothetical protein